jgi:small subunit ribosomal protein S17
MVADTKSKTNAPAKEKPAAKPREAAPKKEATAPAAPADTRDALQKRREIVGTVVSDRMQKTIVVKVDRRVRHTLYAKYVTRSRRFKAHDEKNDAKVGDLVQLVESRPLSREKRWVLQSILRRSGQAPEANV